MDQVSRGAARTLGTLVAETIGANEKTHMDNAGHPHSDAMKTTDRYRRLDFGHMDIELTAGIPCKDDSGYQRLNK